MKLFAVCAALILGASALHAQVVLNLDFTGPDTIVITATGQSPVTSDATHSFFDGIDLEGLFEPNGGTGILTVVSGNLTTGDASGGPAYNSALTDSLSEPNADLNLYIDQSSSTQTFTFGQSAFTFTTSMTITFSGLVFSGVDYGVVVAGYSGSTIGGGDPIDNFAAAAVSTANPTTAIGVYHVTTKATPEPSTYAMMLLGALGLFFFARRRLAA